MNSTLTRRTRGLTRTKPPPLQPHMAHLDSRTYGYLAIGQWPALRQRGFALHGRVVHCMMSSLHDDLGVLCVKRAWECVDVNDVDVSAA